MKGLKEMEIQFLKDEECLHELYETGNTDEDVKMKNNQN